MCDVVIVGAGPYGLAAAAHLDAAGIETRMFGEPMEFWARHMPRGMFLRSSPDCSAIGDPRRELTLDQFRARTGVAKKKPVPIEDFIEYGHWFQREAARNLDRRRVVEIRTGPRGFRLRLEDGESIDARRVVIAAGIGPFAWRPPLFDNLPSALVTHSFEHPDLDRFAGLDVLVVGGGQSALESAALLRETGARVEVVVRAASIFWLGGGKPSTDGVLDAARRLVHPLVRPRLDIMGPRFVSWIVAWPPLFRGAPPALQQYLTAAAVRPAGAAWLVPRLADVTLTTGRSILSAVPNAGAVRVLLDDGTERLVDHVLLATGYRVNVRRYPFLSPELRETIAVHNGYPDLRPGFESSVPGLHFMGTPAAQSFGPICRFVVGTRLSARLLTDHIAGHLAGRSRNGRSKAAAQTVGSYAG